MKTSYDVTQLLTFLVILELCNMSISQMTTPFSDDVASTTELALPPLPLPPIGRLIIDQLVYCPYNNQCYHDSLYSMQNEYGNSCCTGCSCNPYCHVAGNCCPDIIVNFTLPVGNAPQSDFRHKCIYSQLKEEYISDINVIPFIMIAKCPDSYLNMDIQQKCEDPHLFNNLSDISLLIPVESNVANALFRNRYCAQCNYINENVTEMWNPWIICKETYNLMPSSDENLLEFIMGNEDCNLLFRPLDDSNFIDDTCTYGFDVWASCNVSGLWEVYDPYIDAACNAYTSYYSEDVFDEIKYRNVFCYICNVAHDARPQEICFNEYVGTPPWHPGSFSALLNFNQDRSLQTSGESQHEVCPNSYVFDIYEKRCRKLYCSPPNVVRYDGCSPVYKKMRGIAFELFLKMRIRVPTDNINPFIIAELDERIGILRKQLYSDLLCMLTIYMGSENCNYMFSDNINQDCHQTKNYNFILIHVVATFSEKRDVELLLNDIVSFRYKHITFMMNEYFTDVYLDSSFYNLSNLETVLHSSDSLNYFDSQKIECVKPPIRITLQSTCAQIHLSADEFSFNEVNNVCLKRVPKCFTATEYTAIENGTVAICSEKYLNFLKVNSEIDYSENWVSLVCTCLSVICLIFTFLTYCFFPELRTLPGKNNMALVISMTLAQLFFQFGLSGSNNKLTCVVLGICIHFLWLLTVFYMNVCCIHMLRVFLPIRGQSSSSASHARILISYSAYCVAMATLFVSANVGYSLATSDQMLIGYGEGLCYISTKEMVGFTFALPVGLVIISNIIMFLVAVFSIHKMPDLSNATKHERNNLAIYMKLSTITGACWIFGFIYQWTGITALTYTFIILNCCQGIFIMLSFVCNRRVKKLYINICSKRNMENNSSSRHNPVISTNLSQYPSATC